MCLFCFFCQKEVVEAGTGFAQGVSTLCPMETRNTASRSARVLVIDDDPDILESCRLVLKKRFPQMRTEQDPEKIREIVQDDPFDVVLMDMNFRSGDTTGSDGLYWLRKIRFLNPDAAVIMMTAYAGISLAVEAMKEGALDFITKPWDNQHLMDTVSAAAHYALSSREMRRLRMQTRLAPCEGDMMMKGLAAHSPSVRGICEDVAKVAPTDASILLSGSSGSGKSELAQTLHRQSLRAARPLISLELEALTEDQAEMRLFGENTEKSQEHSTPRPALLEQANGGTLLLKNIDHLSPRLQSRLLNAMQSKEFVFPGRTALTPLNIRWIATSRQSRASLLMDPEFRNDLLYEIATVEILLPQLANHREEIPAMVSGFLRHFAQKYRKDVRTPDKTTLRKLCEYPWPGNLGEMRREMERLVVTGDAPLISVEELGLQNASPGIVNRTNLNLDELEKETIRMALQKHKGNLSRASRELGVGRTTLYRKLEKYGI